MKKTILRIVFINLLLISYISHSQTIKVFSLPDNKPILFANILLKPVDGTQQIIITDTNGVASFRNYTNTKYKVEISYVGYKKLSDTIKLDKDYVFYLKPQTSNLNEVVVTGQYAPNSADKAVQQITIIDRKKIDNMAAVTLRDVMTNQLNVRLTQDNILGSNITLQGISGEDVKILVDGVPMVGRQNGNIDLSQINLNNIERIEIIQGPMSVSYGNNALGGTINLITKKTTKSTLEGNVSSYYESIGNYNLNGRLGVHKNKSTINISGGRNYFNGWNPNEKFMLLPKSQLADSVRSQQWKPRQQYFLDGQYIYKIKNLNLNYKGAYFNEIIYDKGYPLAPYGETAFDDYMRTIRFDNVLFLNGDIGHNKYLNFQAAYNDYKQMRNTYYTDLTTLHKVLSGNEGDQDTTKDKLLSSRATLSTKNTKSKINSEVGYDINVETAYGSMIKNGFQRMGDYALFSSVEYKPIDKLTIRPGVRYGYNTLYKAPVTPSINMRYQLNKTHALRFSYAYGFHSPSLQELYFYFVDINHDIIGNPNLKAEQSHNFNLSNSYNGTKWNANWKTESSLFYNYIQNLITLAQVQGAQYTYVNIGIYQTMGAQLNSELSWQQFKISAGGAYVGRYNDLSSDYKVSKFSYSPEIRSSIWYNIKKINLAISVFYKYSGRLPSYVLDGNNHIQQAFVSAYNTADATISKPFLNKRIVLTIGSKNIFNVTNVNSFSSGGVHSSASSSSPVACGRTYFVKLDFNLHTKQ